MIVSICITIVLVAIIAVLVIKIKSLDEIIRMLNEDSNRQEKYILQYILDRDESIKHIAKQDAEIDRLNLYVHNSEKNK